MSRVSAGAGMGILTRRAFKMDKSSLKSGDLALHRIVFLGEFGDRSDPFVYLPALPVPVFVSLHFIEAGVLTDRLVHTLCF